MAKKNKPPKKLRSQAARFGDLETKVRVLENSLTVAHDALKKLNIMTSNAERVDVPRAAIALPEQWRGMDGVSKPIVGLSDDHLLNIIERAMREPPANVDLLRRILGVTIEATRRELVYHDQSMLDDWALDDRHYDAEDDF